MDRVNQENEIDNIIVNLVTTGCEAAEYVKCNTDNIPLVMTMLGDIKELVGKIQSVLISRDDHFAKKNLLYCDNLLYSLDKVFCENEKNKIAECVNLINFELVPLFLDLKKNVDFSLRILPYPEKWDMYRGEQKRGLDEYASCTKDGAYQYKASIVLKAYNKLEYTKIAIESIFKHTDFSSGKYELITVNNGSSDETEQYLNSLPHVKKINLKYNILGTEVGKYICEGKYMVSYSNDAVATSNWLEQLVLCMESDEKIVWAVPTCNADAISNHQGISVGYENNIEMVEQIYAFAEQYNKTNAYLWEERGLLMPFVSIMRCDYLKQCDGMDLLYTQLEFVDDDMSTLFRRAGLKQILAKDTFMHHFGSITLRDGQLKHNSLNNMREVYYKKWGVDAWDAKGDFNQVENLLRTELIGNKPLSLCIEPRFGGNHLQVKNYLKRNGIELERAVGLVLDDRYIEDARYMYDEVSVVKDIEELFKNEGRKFNVIYFGAFLNHIVEKNVIVFLEKVYQLLADKGQIIFAFKNYHSARTAIDLLTMGGLGEYAVTEFSGYNASNLFYKMTEHDLFHAFKIKRIGNYGNYVDDFVNISQTILNCSEKMKNEIRDQLATEYYVVAINKEGN